MSWQGNECFVLSIEYTSDKFSGRMVDAMDSLLDLYDEKGAGWYLLGYFDDDTNEDDFIEYTCKEHGRDPEHRSCWLHNPFMMPGVFAVNVRNSHDLLGMVFECADCDYEVVAYAGDGDEPLERMTVYGKVYDMRTKEAA